MTKLIIKGTAVKEGISRNKRKYISKELKKFAPTLIGRPILKDHEGITDNVIGKVTNAEFIDNESKVVYEGWVKEDGSKIIDKIKDGRISEVSIGAIAGKIVKENKDDDIIIPIDMEAMELSTTPVPGNKGTSIEFENIKLDESSIKKMIEDYKESQSLDNQNINKKEDRCMETTTENNVSENSVEVELKALKEQLESLKESNESLQKDKSDLLEAKRLGEIEKYKKLCELKSISPNDLSKATDEMIQFAIKLVEDLPEADEPVVEEPVKEEPTTEEPAAEEKPDKEKPVAEPESQEPKSEEESENFDGYVITTEDVAGRGVALYKYY